MPIRPFSAVHFIYLYVCDKMINDTNVLNKETSMYNEAQLQIARLHELWLRSEHAANKGDPKTWLWLQDSIWRELRADIERMADASKIIELDNQLKSLALKNIKHYNKLYYILSQRHERLKIIQDKAGKGSKYVRADEDDFE